MRARKGRTGAKLSEHPLAAEFDLLVNVPVIPEQLAQQDNDKYWWRCALGHCWQASPNNRVGKGSGCGVCNGNIVHDFNRLSLNCPDPILLAQWDYARNAPLTPDDVTVHWSKKVWWRCSVVDDHRWPAAVNRRVAGQGCRFCAGLEGSSTNRLSTVRPDIAAQLDEKASGFAADSVGIGSTMVGTWNCPSDPRHPSWEAPVNRRTGGNKAVGSGCYSCRLGQTSRQELRLKAELATVLPIDPDRKTVKLGRGRPEKVDMVAEDVSRSVRLILEFDGVWWHSKAKARRQDAEKARRLRDAGWTVVRIREAGLKKLDDTYDVIVASVAAEEEVAIAVLDHLVRLDVIAPDEAAQYQVGELPKASATAEDWIRKELGSKALSDDRRNQETAWSSMYDALVNFEQESGHCQVPADLQVDGVGLRRWVVKQRSRFRSNELPPERVERLQAIPSWSFRERFWTGFDLYASWLAGLTQHEQRASAWATNVRMRRLALQAKGSDFSSDKLQALADLPGWHWNPREAELDRKISVLRDFVADSGRTIADIKQRDYWGTDPIGTWINTWRAKSHCLTPNTRRLLEDLPGWTWNKRGDTWDTTFAALRAFAAAHGHIAPSLTSTDEHERALARWKRNNKSRKRGCTDPQSQNLRRLLARYGERLP